MKERTIIINGKPFTYNDEGEDMTYETVSPISVEDAQKLLSKTKELFDRCGIRFVLAFGTLLGAVRDGTIIKGDEDVDVFVESEEDLWNNLPFLYNNGLRVCRIEEKLVYSFHVENKSYIDVYILSRLPFSIWSLWCDSLIGKAIPRRYISKFDNLIFLGVDCLVPHNPECILKFWYGESWRVPIKGHIYTYEVPSRYWWRQVVKERCKLLVYFLKLLVTNPNAFVRKLNKRVFKLNK